MKVNLKSSMMVALATSAWALSAAGAFADCGIESGSVRILSNDFEALRVVNNAAGECASGAVTVTSNATTEHKSIQVPALTINPAEYTVAVVANNSIVPLLNDDLIRPLDDLVAQYGQQLLPNQLIKIDGKTMAIAFLGNGQHLFYRKDILDQAGIEPPKTYDEMIAAAKVIQDAGLMEHPLGETDKPGWALAAEFVNIYLGTGGDFFSPGTAELAIGGEDGLKTLEIMGAMTKFMGPDYLTYDANVLKAEYEAGKIAMMNQWGSLAGAILDDEGAVEGVVENTMIAPAPTVNGSVPGAALWWDGFSIAKNISDEDAAASFRAMMNGISPETVAANSDVAVWLVDGYQPGPTAVGVIGNANAGAKPYPMEPYMGLLHNALGAELAEFISGQESAEEALADVKSAYDTAAKEAGFLR